MRRCVQVCWRVFERGDKSVSDVEMDIFAFEVSDEEVEIVIDLSEGGCWIDGRL
jgi:hypothetical protein